MIDVRQAWRGHPGLTEPAVAMAAVALTVLVARAQQSGLSVYPQIGGGAPASLLEEVLPFHWVLTGISGIQPFAWAHTGSDSLVPLLACAALGLRRRHPTGLAVALIVLSTGWPVVVPLLIALFTVATMRPARTTWAVTAGALVPVPVALLLAPYPPGPLNLATTVSAVTLVAGAVGWGLVVVGLRERAVRAETEATLRTEQARQHAREEIAREMHDVLAHRLSLLSMHAGALEYAPGAPPEQLAEAVGVIRHSATRALEDLQDVLKVLRAPVVGDHTEPPQPTRVDVAQLIEESRAAGVELHLRQRVDGSATMSPALARTAYRLLQEALTNHRKHAPGAPVTLTLEGGPETGLTIQVTNPLERVAPAGPVRDSARDPGQGPTQGSVPNAITDSIPNSTPDSVPGPVGAPAPTSVPGPAANLVPGSGQGLIGMRERVDLAGGRLRHRTTPTDFHLDVWLPWTA
ncbi:two-component sensor histidine kinase [Streptomyces umbrinus]|uniref:sensor histidine kinase n=1 Tax=Streptomyces umbrinus TaxID=67370 RepID=UPI0019C45464|nr:histidine kinase [Streptomyces umbrinus]GHB76042.1 two-component sensor histidine kinase [Streptomyces umbrinus]